ncbi:MAG: hypothetical protein ACYCV7_15070 [Acidimicrobiales bacterium]
MPRSSPIGRFDPLSNTFRVRYAANRPAAAARERFASRTITDADGEMFVVALDSMPPVVNLSHQSNLDALGLDDRVSTGRIDVALRADPDPLLETCGWLADAIYGWWDGRPPPLIYRTRTMPAAGRSIAFAEWVSPRVVAVGRLRDATALHAYLVLRAGFTVPMRWIG